ncbi:hypothetical protein OSB04_010254 [Centaurea solstitialis]|uniref:Beta-galactosidase n=1 Tax=Centaurea solstitialis TaxID=347529 RepID=A0AA38TIZ5_9ASTR|nr:hypothetical protein OSB04_010254 [Centaurea solstitialis]
MRGVFLIIASFLVAVAVTAVIGGNVTYDHRALVVDGKRRLLVSGSIHYPRSTPDMWAGLIQKSKEGGLDYDFEGRKDLVNGFPVWLHFIPGIELRTDNEPFKAEMKRFTAKIVDMMKEENLYASQGGPIILSQIENEYGNIDSAYGPAAKTYIKWAASMATSLDTGVPWVMCQQKDAPDPMIDTCNGFYCDGYTPNAKNKPTMWTENWTGWFLSFGGAVPFRPAEDIAFAVARFYQRGGTFQNYYMYHGGTNFGHYGGPFIATSYDYDAPLDEYGQCLSNISGCAAFLANVDTKNDATVNFKGNSYHLPAWSVSILPDCKNVVFNMQSTDIKGDEPFLQEGLRRSAIGNANNPGVSKDVPITVKPGKNKLDLLSVTVGLQGAGITGPVQLNGLKNGSTVDLSSQRGLSQYLVGQYFIAMKGYNGVPQFSVGLKGEALNLYTGGSSLWVLGSSVPKSQPLIWYKTDFNVAKPLSMLKQTSFNAPAGDDPIAIDFTGMGKGEAWVNGESMGLQRAIQFVEMPPELWETVTNAYDYFTDRMNLADTMYQRSWLKPSGNVLVLFEEIGGNPTQISFATHELESLCSRVSESHPLPMEAWTRDKKSRRNQSQSQSQESHSSALILIKSSIQSSLLALEHLKGNAEVSVMVNAEVPTPFRSYKRRASGQELATLKSRQQRLVTLV